jgi:hypothetical protein
MRARGAHRTFYPHTAITHLAEPTRFIGVTILAPIAVIASPTHQLNEHQPSPTSTTVVHTTTLRNPEQTLSRMFSRFFKPVMPTA